MPQLKNWLYLRILRMSCFSEIESKSQISGHPQFFMMMTTMMMMMMMMMMMVMMMMMIFSFSRIVTYARVFRMLFIWFYPVAHAGHAATVPGTVGPDSWPTDNQQTSKPAKQRTNRPTSQQSNKQKHTEQQERLTKSWPKTRSKVVQKSTKNPTKFNQQSIKNHPNWALGGSWGLLGGSWRALGWILASRAKICPKRLHRGHSGATSWTPNLAPKSGKIGSKSDPKGDHFFDWLCGRVLVAFGTNLGPTWPPKLSPNRPKLVKIHQKRDQDADHFFASFFIALGTLLCQFSFEVRRPRGAKSIENLIVF